MDLPLLQRTLLQQQGQLQPDYPVKLIQFGTGALLRGLIDFIIHQSNEMQDFQGSIATISSTQSGRTQQLNLQEGLFTQWIEGYSEGNSTREAIVNQAIRYAYAASDQWTEVKALAQLEHLEIIISNTTEIGIQYHKDDIFQLPPATFPGKLTSFLYERMQHHPHKKVVVLPTELITDNGKVLKEIVLKHADDHQLPPEFYAYLEHVVIFGNTLVDRIVSGKPESEKHEQIQTELGYRDELLTVSEQYFLWAIEGPEELSDLLSFMKAFPQIILDRDISPYRERKLRLLNGTHTISVALGYIYGLETIFDCMEDVWMSQFIQRVMKDEIGPSLPENIPDTDRFADEVLDRFRNPYLNHKLLDITFQYTSKMGTRNLATLNRYAEKKGKIPSLMTLGFAAYLTFLHPIRQEGKQFWGAWQGQEYLIRDQHAGWMMDQWAKKENMTTSTWVDQLLGHTNIWGGEFLQKGEMVNQVSVLLDEIEGNGVGEVLKRVLGE